MRVSISIIGLKGGMDRSINKPDQSSNPTGAPAEISEKDYLGECLFTSGEKIGNFCQ